jgi:hypothetical protein
LGTQANRKRTFKKASTDFNPHELLTRGLEKQEH